MWTMQKRGPADSSDGTQSIERAIVLLRILATRGRVGWGLSELAGACGLKKATAHRILARLERERLVHRRSAGQHYFLGAMIGELSMSVHGLHAFVQEAQEFTGELARAASLVAIVSLRSGDHFVVLARAKTTLLQGQLNEVGARRPLISTAGGAAILLGLETGTQDRIIASNRAELGTLGRSSIDAYIGMWTRSRELGYGLNSGDIAPGVHAVAVPVCNRSGEPFASIALAGTAELLPLSRCDELVLTLRRQVVRLARIAAQLHPDLYDCREPAE